MAGDVNDGTTGILACSVVQSAADMRHTAKPRPWNAPQITKFQEAPCHSPPSNMVMNKLRYVATRPPREPPSGMYK